MGISEKRHRYAILDCQAVDCVQRRWKDGNACTTRLTIPTSWRRRIRSTTQRLRIPKVSLYTTVPRAARHVTIFVDQEELPAPSLPEQRLSDECSL